MLFSCSKIFKISPQPLRMTLNYGAPKIFMYSFSWLHIPFFVTQHRRYSFSILPKSCPCNSSYLSFDGFEILLTVSYDMVWQFLTAHADSDLVFPTPSMCLIGQNQSYAECFVMTWRCAYDFGFFSYFWQSYSLLSFSNF